MILGDMMHMKSSNYKVSRAFIQGEEGEYKEIYTLHPVNHSALGYYRLALLEIKKNRLTNKGIDKLIEFLQELKNSS